MVARKKELYYWMKKKEWYGITPKGEYYLKDEAPPEARESFEKFKKANLD